MRPLKLKDRRACPPARAAPDRPRIQRPALRRAGGPRRQNVERGTRSAELFRLPNSPWVDSRLRLRASVAILCLAISSLGGGCIARTLTIESEPAGADVRLNGRAVGRTPVTVSFLHYGAYSVELAKEGRAPVRAERLVAAPGWARFPACLFTELLWPGTIRDSRTLSFALPPERTPSADEVLTRAGEARAKARPSPPATSSTGF